MATCAWPRTMEPAHPKPVTWRLRRSWSGCGASARGSVAWIRRSDCARPASTCSSAKRAFTGPDSIEVGGARLAFRRALIATGARPDTPKIPGLAEAGYLTNETVFDLAVLPKRLLVIGGGPLGCELAQAFCRFGARTTIAQDAPLFLPKEERDAAQLLSEALAHDGVEVRLNTAAVRVCVENGEKVVDLVSDDYHSRIAVDEILTGVGRVPNVHGLNLEAAGVDVRCGNRHRHRRLPAHLQPAHLRGRRR